MGQIMDAGTVIAMGWLFRGHRVEQDKPKGPAVSK